MARCAKYRCTSKMSFALLPKQPHVSSRSEMDGWMMKSHLKIRQVAAQKLLTSFIKISDLTNLTGSPVDQAGSDIHTVLKDSLYHTFLSENNEMDKKKVMY